MVLRLDDAFFARVEAAELARVREVLRATLAEGPEADAWMGEFWHQAVEERGLKDGPVIARLFAVEALRPEWSQDPLHARYAEAMMNPVYDMIAFEDGVHAVFQNVVLQHYAEAAP